MDRVISDDTQVHRGADITFIPAGKQPVIPRNTTRLLLLLDLGQCNDEQGSESSRFNLPKSVPTCI